MKENLYISAIAFVVIAILLIVLNLNKLRKIKNKKHYKKEIKFIEIQFLNMKYNIDPSRLLNAGFLILVSIINALIISLTFLIIMLVPLATAYQLMIGFIVLMVLIYVIYGLIGIILKKKGN